MLSDNASQQVRAREKAQAILMLVTISPPGFDPILLVNNNESITSNGNVYSPIQMFVDISFDDGKTLQSVDLVIENVSLEMIDWIRQTTDPVPIMIQSIFSGNPDRIERQLSGLVLRQAKYDSRQITAKLFGDDDFNQLLPSDTYNSHHYAGLF